MVRALAVLARGPGFQPQSLSAFHFPLLVLSVHSEMSMDLNQKTLVSQECCIGFVDCRRTNLQTIYHPICTTGYWKKLGVAWAAMAEDCNLFTTLKVTINFCVIHLPLIGKFLPLKYFHSCTGAKTIKYVKGYVIYIFYS